MASGTYSNSSEFEKSLSGTDDIRLQEYSKSYNEERDYNKGLERVLDRAISEDGYNSAEETINRELRDTNRALKAMPNRKTPGQLGREEALKERVELLQNVKKRKGESGKGRGKVDIIT